MVSPARFALANLGLLPVCLPGPGVVLAAALLGRLTVDCQATLDFGDDPCGDKLRQVLQAASPHLRSLVRRSPASVTAHCSLHSLLHPDWTMHGAIAALPLLPPLAEYRGALGIWTGAEHCEALSTSAEFALPSQLRVFSDTGITRILALGAPGDALLGSSRQHEWLRAAAPHVEILCGQADHLLRYIDPKAASAFDDQGQLANLAGWLNGALLHQMAGFLLSLGAAVVVIGLREHGIYLRTHADGNRVAFARRFAPDQNVAAYLATWLDREMLVPLFAAEIRNAFSRTDACAAACAAGLLAGQSPGDLVLSLAAVVSLAGESENPLDGVPSWEVLQARIEGGWPQAHCGIDLSGWGEEESRGW